MNKLTALIEAAKAATPGPWIAGRMEVTGSSDNREPYSPWFLGAGPRPISVGRGTCIHADDMAFIALANPTTILELCTLLEKAEEALDHMVRAAAERHCGLKIADEALAEIKRWKEQT